MRRVCQYCGREYCGYGRMFCSYECHGKYMSKYKEKYHRRRPTQNVLNRMKVYAEKRELIVERKQ